MNKILSPLTPVVLPCLFFPFSFSPLPPWGMALLFAHSLSAGIFSTPGKDGKYFFSFFHLSPTVREPRHSSDLIFSCLCIVFTHSSVRINSAQCLHQSVQFYDLMVNVAILSLWVPTYISSWICRAMALMFFYSDCGEVESHFSLWSPLESFL